MNTNARLVLSTLIILAMLSPARASEWGTIAIFSDATLTDPTLVDDVPRMVDIYIAHLDFGGVTGSEFRTEADAGFTGVWLSETSPWSPYVIGTSPTGVAIAYAQCVMSDIIVIKATYLLTGTSAPCSRLRVVPSPGHDLVVCSGCHFVDGPCGAGSLAVSCPVPVEETTWGRVKALYR